MRRALLLILAPFALLACGESEVSIEGARAGGGSSGAVEPPDPTGSSSGVPGTSSGPGFPGTSSGTTSSGGIGTSSGTGSSGGSPDAGGLDVGTSDADSLDSGAPDVVEPDGGSNDSDAISTDFGTRPDADTGESDAASDGGTPSPTRVPCRLDYDFDGDGAVDARDDVQTDSQGRISNYVRDADMNGTYDFIGQVTYDLDHGKLGTVSWTRATDGALVLVQEIDYDSRGNRISEKLDNGADNVIDEHQTWNYDANDRPVRTVLVVRGESQRLPFTRDMYYDGAGRWNREDIDYYSDHSIDLIWSYYFDTSDRRIRGEGDADRDGISDVRATYGYTASGDLERISLDSDADGTFDVERTIVYDAQGRIVSDSRTSSGTLAERTSYFYACP